MNKSDSISELATALSKAQSEMHGAKKESQNPFFKSKYADLESIWNAIREPLAKNGLSVVQTTGMTDDGHAYLCTILLHSSGQWIEGTFPLKPVKDDPQGMGSCISYIRRYTLASVTGVVQVDDDAEAAQGRTKVSAPPQKSPEPQTTQAPKYASHQPPEPPPIGELVAKATNTAPQKGYIGRFGKYLNKDITNFPMKELNNYVEWLDKDAMTKGKPMGALAIELKNEVLKLNENKKQTSSRFSQPEIIDVLENDDIPF